MADPDLFLFVSHVREDRPAALDIVEELERRGVPCWIAPRDVRPGRPFDDEIAEAIEASRAMLLVFSEHCNEHDYIRREITVAGESHKIIIPFRIEDAQPKRGLRVRLSDLHWIDGFVSRERAIDQVVRTFDPGRARRQDEEPRRLEEERRRQREAEEQRRSQQEEQQLRQEEEERRCPREQQRSAVPEIPGADRTGPVQPLRTAMLVGAGLLVLIALVGIGFVVQQKLTGETAGTAQPVSTPAPAPPGTPVPPAPLPRPGWLGVQIQNVTPAMAENLRLSRQEGALVTSVTANGPAVEAGLKPGDVIIAANGHPIKSVQDLPPIVARSPVGSRLTLEIVRNGNKMMLDAVVAARPSNLPTPAPQNKEKPLAIPDLNYGEEHTDFGVSSQDFLRPASLIATPTPTTIPGGWVVDTAHLYTGLKYYPDSAVLIDALNAPGHLTLLKAHRLPWAGKSGIFNDSISRRLASWLAALTGGNREKYLVFFCQGARCWESYNAALRAIHLGFSHVYWYRGGLSSWKAAGLLLVP